MTEWLYTRTRKQGGGGAPDDERDWDMFGDREVVYRVAVSGVLDEKQRVH